MAENATLLQQLEKIVACATIAVNVAENDGCTPKKIVEGMKQWQTMVGQRKRSSLKKKCKTALHSERTNHSTNERIARGVAQFRIGCGQLRNTATSVRKKNHDRNINKLHLTTCHGYFTTGWDQPIFLFVSRSLKTQCRIAEIFVMSNLQNQNARIKTMRAQICRKSIICSNAPTIPANRPNQERTRPPHQKDITPQGELAKDRATETENSGMEQIRWNITNPHCGQTFHELESFLAPSSSQFGTTTTKRLLSPRRTSEYVRSLSSRTPVHTVPSTLPPLAVPSRPQQDCNRLKCPHQLSSEEQWKSEARTSIALSSFADCKIHVAELRIATNGLLQLLGKPWPKSSLAQTPSARLHAAP